MNYTKLHKHINALACLPTTSSPLISAYFNLDEPRDILIQDYKNWCSLARHTFEDTNRVAFDDAAEEILTWLENAEGKSGAVFSRWDDHPFFLPMSFDVPLETSFMVGDCPKIYPLVELKDRFNRFVLVLLTDARARILEVNLGSASVEVLTDRPAIRERIGREWTKEHYNNQRKEKDKIFLKDKIGVIENLMSKTGNSSLIIAGNDRHVNQLTASLPKHLKEKVVDQLKMSVVDKRTQEVMQHAIAAFLDAEANESHDTVFKMVDAFHNNGLAALGIANTHEALDNGQVSHLVVSKDLLRADREALVAKASRMGIPIETVQGSELLERHGCVGALLRYKINLGYTKNQTQVA